MDKMEVPEDVLSSDLSLSAKTTLTWLYLKVNRARKDGFVWHKRAYIAKSLGKTELQIRRDLAQLAEKGYVTDCYKFIGSSPAVQTRGILIASVEEKVHEEPVHGEPVHEEPVHGDNKRVHGEPLLHYRNPKEPNNSREKESSQIPLIEVAEEPTPVAKNQDAIDLVTGLFDARKIVTDHLHAIGRLKTKRPLMKLTSKKDGTIRRASKAIEVFGLQQVQSCIEFALAEMLKFSEYTEREAIDKKWTYWEEPDTMLSEGCVRHNRKLIERLK